MPERNVAAFQRLIAEVWNRGDLTVVDELVATDYEGHDPSWPQGINGREGFKQWVDAARALFPDFHITVEDVIAEGEKLAARITMQGTHHGSIPGFPPPTGRRASFQGILMRRFADGQMAEGWDLADMMGLLRQLGVSPAP